jgi:hypothetical protein
MHSTEWTSANVVKRTRTHLVSGANVTSAWKNSGKARHPRQDKCDPNATRPGSKVKVSS